MTVVLTRVQNSNNNSQGYHTPTMAPGAVSQQLIAGGLPARVKLSITDLNFKIPGTDWWPGWPGPHKSVHRKMSASLPLLPLRSI